MRDEYKKPLELTWVGCPPPACETVKIGTARVSPLYVTPPGTLFAEGVTNTDKSMETNVSEITLAARCFTIRAYTLYEIFLDGMY
jgi:hypothetical protein